VINDLSPTEQAGEWKGLQCLVKVEPVRYFKCSGKEENDTCPYLLLCCTGRDVDQQCRPFSPVNREFPALGA
jgi:hypothetical protein